MLEINRTDYEREKEARERRLNCPLCQGHFELV